MPLRRAQKPASSSGKASHLWWAISAGLCLSIAAATLGYHLWAVDTWQKQAETTGASVKLQIVSAEPMPAARPADVLNLEEQAAPVPEEPAAPDALLPGAAPAAEPPEAGEPTTPPGAQETTLKDAPSDALSEANPLGILPKIASDGTKPWQYYARPFARPGRTPMIAIIVTGLGANQEVTDAATQLNPNISLSFSPYAKDVALWAQSARRRGHEALVDLPMETKNYPAEDPGPHALLSGIRPETNEEHLVWLMSRFPGHIGFVTPADEVLTRNMDIARPFLQPLNQRGLMLVLTTASEESQWVTQTLPTLLADRIIDQDPTIESLTNNLEELEKIAKERGVAVGIAHAYPLTLHTLKAWSEAVESRGIILAPVSAIARMKFS